MTQKEALEMLKLGHTVFLTGAAGSGKTHVLMEFIRHLQKHHVHIGLTASTGIAATHIGGITLDAWSGTGLNQDLSMQEINRIVEKKIYRERLSHVGVLIIDEISMVHAAKFDLVDRVLRVARNINEPFGGVQLVMCGDFFQLPPVSDDKKDPPYVFYSKVWHDIHIRCCYLATQYRQVDHELLKILMTIRTNSVTDETKEAIQKTAKKNFNWWIRPTKLYTHNVDVDRMNQEELEKISGQSHVYTMSSSGKDALVEMLKRGCLAPEQLELKKGAQVMFVKNNFKQGYVNGTLGKIIGFGRHNEPIVEVAKRRYITVFPDHWTILDDEQRVLAEIIQLPLRLAWAITVHKSQGMTMDAAEIDLSKAFIPGMGYVAISRVKSLSGLKITGINDIALRVYPHIVELDSYLKQQSQKNQQTLQEVGWWKRFFKKRSVLNRLTRFHTLPEHTHER